MRDTLAVMQQISRALDHASPNKGVFSKNAVDFSIASAVVFLLGTPVEENGFSSDLSLILNKRSLKVKQPGDLCYPGGSISSRLDSFLAKLLYLPGSPLTRWPYWSKWRMQRHRETKTLALLFATSLRESFEEMRLNPLGVNFLGPLPSQRLVMFRKVIYPMVCWAQGQKRFFPNREVERVVFIPIKNLVNPSNYALYRLRLEMPSRDENKPGSMDYPCFIHRNKDESEVLWGATFRITMVFLEIVFGFKPPGMASLPVVHGTLTEYYLTGDA